SATWGRTRLLPADAAFSSWTTTCSSAHETLLPSSSPFQKEGETWTAGTKLSHNNYVRQRLHSCQPYQLPQLPYSPSHVEDWKRRFILKRRFLGPNRSACCNREEEILRHGRAIPRCAVTHRRPHEKGNSRFSDRSAGQCRACPGADPRASPPALRPGRQER